MERRQSVQGTPAVVSAAPPPNELQEPSGPIPLAVMNEMIGIRSIRSGRYSVAAGWFLKTNDTTSVSTTIVLMRRDRICHAHATAEGRPGTPRLARLLARSRLAESWDRESALFPVGRSVHPPSD